MSIENMIIGIVALSVFVIVIIFRGKKDSLKSVDPLQSSDADRVQEKRHAVTQEAKNAVPKLPKNETLYQILTNTKLTSNDASFDFNYMLDEIVLRIQQDVKSNSVELLFDIDKEIPSKLLGSPKRLSRVLINLIENGVIYSEKGLVQLSISLKSSSAKQVVLSFTVVDEGKGMDATEIEALYSEPESRKKDGYLPLGFYVAKELIASEHGELSVLSHPGKGTRILFELTFALPHSGKDAESVRMPSQKCRSLRVAVCERCERTAEQLQHALRPFVAEVDIFLQSGRIIDAEAFIAYDMVVVDHRHINEATADALKQNNISVIVTQSVLEDTAAAQIDFPVDYMISKPFTEEHIIEMLTVFYGVEEVVQTPSKTMGKAPEETVEDNQTRFETFVSDAEIPITKNVTKKDFDIFVGAKVLIVEDNLINQRVIKGLLGSSGIDLFFAENGLDALEVVDAEEIPFDLVLMDINMPVLDGIETTRRIRKKSKYDLMPIVAFTGLNLQEQIDKMREAGMNAHMAKPLNIGRVFSIFDHYLPKS